MHIYIRLSVTLLLAYNCYYHIGNASIRDQQQKINDLPKMCFLPNVCEHIKELKLDSAIPAYCKPKNISDMLQSKAEKEIENILFAHYLDSESQLISKKHAKYSKQVPYYDSIKKTVLESYWLLLKPEKRKTLVNGNSNNLINTLDFDYHYDKEIKFFKPLRHKASLRIKKIARLKPYEHHLLNKYLSDEIILLHILKNYGTSKDFSPVNFIGELCLEWEKNGRNYYSNKSADVGLLLKHFSALRAKLKQDTHDKMLQTITKQHEMPPIENIFEANLDNFLSQLIEVDNLSRSLKNIDKTSLGGSTFNGMSSTNKILYFISFIDNTYKTRYIASLAVISSKLDRQYLNKIYNISRNIPDFNAIRSQLKTEIKDLYYLDQSPDLIVSLNELEILNPGGSDIAIKIGNDLGVNSLVAKLLYINSWMKNIRTILNQDNSSSLRQVSAAFFESLNKYKNNDSEQYDLQSKSEYFTILKYYANYFILKSLNFNQGTKDPQFVRKFEQLDAKNKMLSKLEAVFTERTISYRHIPMRSIYLQNILELLLSRYPFAANEEILIPLIRLKYLLDNYKNLLNKAPIETKSDEISDTKEELLAWNTSVLREFLELTEQVIKFTKNNIRPYQQGLIGFMQAASISEKPAYDEMLDEYINNQASLLFANPYYTDALLEEVFEP